MYTNLLNRLLPLFIGYLLFGGQFVVEGKAQEAQEQEPIKALLIEGQNNHKNWRTTSLMMKSYLEQTDLFSVDIVRTRAKGTDPNFRPDFSQYQLIVSNYNGADWPEETKAAFIEYIKAGGGLVVVHAADNAFGNWREYNEMIGLGGWGGRNQDSGPHVFLNDDGETVRDESDGKGGGHGPQHSFSLITRTEHPIMEGLPGEWKHVRDELYHNLRGPAANMEILATSFSSPKRKGTGKHEPMIMTIGYGEGRIFHTPMGHGNDSQECVGFITVLQRGAQWAATGNVTIPVPEDFPTADAISRRPFVPPVEDAELGNVKNVHQLGNLYTGGQFDKEGLQIIKDAGIEHVITLRTTKKVDWEQGVVEEAGLKFHAFRFGNETELTDEIFNDVRKTLQMTADEKVLLHCGSANRAAAVWAAFRVLDQGVELENAIGEAKELGLKSEAMLEKTKGYIEANKR